MTNTKTKQVGTGLTLNSGARKSSHLLSTSYGQCLSPEYASDNLEPISALKYKQAREIN